MTSHPPHSSPTRSDRSATHECLTTYPPHWIPAMLKARLAAYPHAPRNAPPLFSGFALSLLVSVAVLCFVGSSFAAPADAVASAIPGETSLAGGSIPAYQARFGRTRPLIAVIGENRGTEVTDFVIPYGVLVASGVAEVVTVATQRGNLRMLPALTIQPDATVQEFDARFPDGADYVIVPAVMHFQDPALLAWLKAQGTKGGTLVSICDGAAVVAGTGLMDGHRATGHWASEKNRRKLFRDVNWIADVRYVADGKIVSTAGISASLPASLALVEAIAGRERTRALATELGVSDWSTEHRTAPFRPRLGVNLKALITVNYTNHWFRSTEMLGLALTPGVDEIAFAVTADAYTRTGRSMVHALAASAEPIRTRHGLRIVPDTLTSSAHAMDRMLPALDATPSGQWLAKSIDDLTRRYGRTTAYGVALDFEFPMIPQSPTPTARAISRQ